VTVRWLDRYSDVSVWLAASLLAAAATGCSSGGSAATANPDAGPADATTKPDAGSPDAGGEASVDAAGDAGGGDAPAGDAGPDTSFLNSDAGPPSLTSLPAKGAFMGAFVDIINGYDAGAATDTNSEARFVAAETEIGRKLVIDNRFYSDADEIISVRTQWDVANHIVPLITWMPYGNGDPLVEIIRGDHDAAIQAEAQKSKALGVQFFMRWAHEMNGNWYPWAGYVNGAAGSTAGDAGPDAASDAGAADGGSDAGVVIPSSGPAKYVAAWRHVHDIFVAEGATNVVWVWAPIVNDVPQVGWNHWTNYYPGDAYVDWVGIDVYNWGSSSSCCIWTSFAALMTGCPYQDYAKTKPIMLPETASAEVGGNKAAWIDAMHQNLMTEFQDVRAVVWFDINKETDWRIDSSPATLAAYQSMALDPYFNP
jgi:beta-mannanase